MDRVVGELFAIAAVELVSIGIRAAIDSRREGRVSSRTGVSPLSSTQSLTVPTASVHHPRAVLTSSSSMKFGNDCERLVNIAFQTSQTFPTLMSTCADIIHYLQKELAKHYPDELFQVVIGNNGDFDFSIDDGEYFAQIEQDRYRVVIFATKRDASMKSDTHDANTQMRLLWK